jgi:II/X family phage/plasmid replication protein
MKTGAIITRVDLTKNYLTGSPDNASRLMHYLGGMHRRNKPAKSYGTGVTWGEGSKYWYGKMYNKGLEMTRDKNADPALVECVVQSGLVRDEISLKTRFLTQNGYNEIGTWTNGEDMENVIYGLFSSVLTQTEVSTDDFESIPGRLGEIAIAWRNGIDMKARLPRNTFYRYRKQLKAYGIDISERCDISKLAFRCEVIKLQEVYPGENYFLPKAA